MDQRVQSLMFMMMMMMIILGIILCQIVYIITVIPDKNNLHLPWVTLAMYQKGVNYSGIKILNGLPNAIKDICSKPEKFNGALKRFLHTH